MTLQSNEYLRRLTTSIIWCKETPSVTVTLSLWFITGLNSGSYPEPNSFFRSLASMPSDWVISDVLFSETNTVAWLYWFTFSSCLTCEGNDELYSAYYFSQNKIKLFYSDLSAFFPDLRFSSLQSSKLILQWYHLYFIKHVRWHKVAVLSGTQVPSARSLTPEK